jgi:hypothetical protein
MMKDPAKDLCIGEDKRTIWLNLVWPSKQTMTVCAAYGPPDPRDKPAWSERITQDAWWKQGLRKDDLIVLGDLNQYLNPDKDVKRIPETNQRKTRRKPGPLMITALEVDGLCDAVEYCYRDTGAPYTYYEHRDRREQIERDQAAQDGSAEEMDVAAEDDNEEGGEGGNKGNARGNTKRGACFLR